MSDDYADIGSRVRAMIENFDDERDRQDDYSTGLAVAEVMRLHGWTPPPLTGDALLQRVCLTCQQPAYFGDYCSQHAGDGV